MTRVLSIDRRLLSFPTSVLLIFVMSGCYHYRIMDKDASPVPPAEYRHKTIHSLAWGLIQQDIRAAECGEPGKTRGLDEVRITSNLGYDLITVMTLGFWSPIYVEYRCKPSAPEVGDF